MWSIRGRRDCAGGLKDLVNPGIFAGALGIARKCGKLRKQFENYCVFPNILDDLQQNPFGFIGLAHFDERPSEQDPRSQVIGIKMEAFLADCHGFLPLAGGAQFFRQKREHPRPGSSFSISL